jgi:nucleoside phosphorylase
MAPRYHDEFQIAIICALPLKADALFNEHYEELDYTYGKHIGGANSYIRGRIHNHDVVLAYMLGMGNWRYASIAHLVLLHAFLGANLITVVLASLEP